MWVYIERLEAGTWVNSGSANVNNDFVDQFPPLSFVSKMAISEPMRSYIKKSLLAPYVYVASDPDGVIDVPGINLDKHGIYRYVFLLNRR